ncbi:hypothetical protein SAMN05216296_0713 [Pseudomonas pohangensis]|uniref:Uncharacterized protein n=1 Tax=Pseudomonas pohangensis TaxID=364197 RepID=A0A1H2EET3_9PSED|nr:hypothetical protein SAMN05216296_0713 [Pseudomonas pohangensis]
MFLTMLVRLRPYCAQNPAATPQQAGQDGSIGLPCRPPRAGPLQKNCQPPRRQSGNGLSAARKSRPLRTGLS